MQSIIFQAWAAVGPTKPRQSRQGVPDKPARLFLPCLFFFDCANYQGDLAVNIKDIGTRRALVSGKESVNRKGKKVQKWTSDIFFGYLEFG